MERRLFALLHQIARTGEYPEFKYVDISDSDSDADYELELELPVDGAGQPSPQSAPS